MSRQSWAIVYKMREVDEVLRQDPTLQSRIREVHPAVSFYFLSGERAVQHSKKTKEGKEERRRLLATVFLERLEGAARDKRLLACNEDDVMDAFSAIWTAERILTGKARIYPQFRQKTLLNLERKIGP
jgi:predicted RNase H-like nuclease